MLKGCFNEVVVWSCITEAKTWLLLLFFLGFAATKCYTESRLICYLHVIKFWSFANWWQEKEHYVMSPTWGNVTDVVICIILSSDGVDSGLRSLRWKGITFRSSCTHRCPKFATRIQVENVLPYCYENITPSAKMSWNKFINFIMLYMMLSSPIQYHRCLWKKKTCVIKQMCHIFNTYVYSYNTIAYYNNSNEPAIPALSFFNLLLFCTFFT